MVKLHHIRQLSVAPESTVGTENTSHSASTLVRVRELTVETSPQYFERPLHSRSFGYTPRISQNSSCTVSFAVEMAGDTANSSSWSTAPIWGGLLKACGFRQDNIYAVDVSAAVVSSGPFQHRESASDGTTTVTVFGRWYTGESQIYTNLAGTALSGTLTGATSGASFTVGTEDGTNQAGYCWSPSTGGSAGTTANSAVTLYIYNDGDLIKVYGCRGDVTIDCQSQDVPLMRFTMQGIFNAETNVAMIDDTVTGSYSEKVPPTFVADGTNAALELYDGTNVYAASDVNFTGIQFTMGNNVVMRQNSNQPSGWLSAHIANRTPNGSFNPDEPGSTNWDMRTLLQQNTRYALDCRWGTATYNKFRILAPAVEFDSIGDGERDEVQSPDISFRMTRGFESGADTNSIGKDNEFLLFHF
jgi:hypothetical protein